MVFILLLIFIIAWIFILLPSIVFLRTSWQLRFDSLKNYLPEDALKLYFDQFFTTKYVENNNLMREFENFFYHNYGKRHYIIPIILLSIISGIGFFVTASHTLYWLEHTFNHVFFLPYKDLIKQWPPIAISGFLGAYMWVAYDQIRRYRMRDFTSYDVYLCNFRLLIAIPIGLIFSFTVKEPIGIPLAFFLGTFPVKSLFKLGKRFTAKYLDIRDQRDESTSELEQLQSINKVEADRFHEEGVSNILQLAYSDPVELTIRTNFDFNYILECMNQALLWIFIERNQSKLRELGLRGSYEACILLNMLNSNDKEQKEIANKNLFEISKVLKISKESLHKILLDIFEDPYTKFIYNIWKQKNKR